VHEADRPRRDQVLAVGTATPRIERARRYGSCKGQMRVDAFVDLHRARAHGIPSTLVTHIRAVG
jgi:hypothetical protein